MNKSFRTAVTNLLQVIEEDSRKHGDGRGQVCYAYMVGRLESIIRFMPDTKENYEYIMESLSGS